MLDKIALGTAQLDMVYGINNQNTSSDPSRAQAILDCAYQRNVQYIDTARAYGKALDLVAQNPNSFQVFSKFLTSDQSFFDALDEHLNLLKSQSLFCLSFHRYNDFSNFNEWEKLDTLKQEHGFSCGVSVGSDEEAISAIESEKIQWVQLPFNLLDNAQVKAPVFETALKHGVSLQVRSVYLQGLFFMEAKSLPEHLEELKNPLSEIQQIGKQYNIPMAELGLRYAGSFQAIQSITFGVDNVEQLNTNLDLAEKGPLEEAICDQISQVVVENRRLLNPANWNQGTR